MESTHPKDAPRKTSAVAAPTKGHAAAARPTKERAALGVRRRLGKYRIERKLSTSSFATVYAAYDTISGVRVALKLPYASHMDAAAVESFKREVRLASKIDHPNILPVKDAGHIDGRFVIASPLGDETLADRLTRRLSPKLAREYATQILEAVAAAHRQRVMHCDLKPENIILFPENRVRLADFGIAKVALRTLAGSGAGTVGYIAPEQALGKPSLRSDVFSLGLMLYRMFAGKLPEWPFEWPPPGIERLRRVARPRLIALIRRAIEVESGKRFADADALLRSFRRLGAAAILATPRRNTARRRPSHDWRELRQKQFLREYGAALQTRGKCVACRGPVSEAMPFCPWCCVKRRVRKTETRYPRQCPRCRRGMKSDWRFCPWCFGPAVHPDATPRYADARYTALCANKACEGQRLMPFMRYCPWCRRRTGRAWKFPGATQRCARCRWSVAADYWECCPWCGRPIRKTKR